MGMTKSSKIFWKEFKLNKKIPLLDQMSIGKALNLDLANEN